MEVYKCGIYVIIKSSGIRAMITACVIRFQNMSYEVSYFSDGQYTSIWLNEFEFDTDREEKTKIGFKKD
jgi:hypothetical protein